MIDSDQKFGSLVCDESDIFIRGRAGTFQKAKIDQLHMLELRETSLLQCLASAFLRAAVNHKNPFGGTCCFDDSLNTPADAGEAIHLAHLVGGQLPGGTVGNAAYISCA